MAEQTMPDGRVMDIAFKYTRPKTRGTYKSGHNDSGSRVTKRKKKTGGGPAQPVRRKILGANGKFRWE